ncbi:MAG: hypothetical protein ACYCSR_07835 [Thiomonas sp.]|uniref:Lipoprotein n=1 Tax=mine drainage metagenome TaxID=410659 RepID=E6PW43_9ZZZZ
MRLILLAALLAASLSGCIVVPPRAGVYIQPYGMIQGGWYHRWGDDDERR